ncbi:MAG: hypothetical protein WBJ10_15270 [Daejeonella sp.]
MNKFLSFNIAIELICFFIALFYLQSDKKAFWKMFIPFLLLTVITELYGRYIGRYLHQPNGWLYNIYLIIEIAFIHFILARNIELFFRKSQLIVGVSLAVVGVMYFVETAYLQTEGFYNTTFKVFSINTVVLCLFFYYGFVKQESYIPIKKYPPFWIIAGILFFYFGGTVMNFIYNVLTIEITPNKTIRSYINHVLILLLYSFWSYSFICRHRTRILQPSSR